MLGQVRRARELALQGVNALNQSPAAREALAAEVEQIRESLIDGANTTLPRPSGLRRHRRTAPRRTTPTAPSSACPATCQRTIGEDVKVAVNVDGPDAFGPDGASLFDDLTALADALRAGDADGHRRPSSARSTRR